MDYVRWIRAHVGRMPLLMAYGTAIVADAQGRVLWQRRGDMGWWGFPGGVVEPGETLTACAEREVAEETGLQVKVERLVGVYSSPDYAGAYPNGDQVQQVTFCFATRVIGGALRIDGRETTDLVWRAPGDAMPTARWYKDMAADWRRGAREAAFRGGAPGARGQREPYFRTVRRHVGQAAFVYPAAAASIRDEHGHVLLQRRRDTGEWGLPSGLMELGERLDQTVVSEVREETGLEVEPLRLIGVYSGPPMQIRYPHGDELQLISALFACRPRGGVLRPDGFESLEVGYFSPEALPDVAPRWQGRLADALADRPGAIIA